MAIGLLGCNVFFWFLDVCFISRVYVTVFAAIHGYPTVKCFVICIKDRSPDRHSCLNLHPCVIQFSQSVSRSLSQSVRGGMCDNRESFSIDDIGHVMVRSCQ